MWKEIKNKRSSDTAATMNWVIEEDPVERGKPTTRREPFPWQGLKLYSIVK